MTIIIREEKSDQAPAQLIQKAAFGADEEANLTQNLLFDPSAQPSLSLLAYYDEQPVGHILFSRVSLAHHPNIQASLLAPLAVLPEFQRQGIGLALIRAGLEELKQRGDTLAFVLGHINYYPKAGFFPAHTLGIAAPYPIEESLGDAWMVHTLGNPQPKKFSTHVICANTLMRPEYWAE